jgi:hypothetical protein
MKLTKEQTFALWRERGIEPAEPYLFKLTTEDETLETIELCKEIANTSNLIPNG